MVALPRAAGSVRVLGRVRPVAKFFIAAAAAALLLLMGTKAQAAPQQHQPATTTTTALLDASENIVLVQSRIQFGENRDVQSSSSSSSSDDKGGGAAAAAPGEGGKAPFSIGVSPHISYHHSNDVQQGNTEDHAAPATPTPSFTIDAGQTTMLSVSPQGTVRVAHLEADSVHADKLVINGVPQFTLVAMEVFQGADTDTDATSAAWGAAQQQAKTNSGGWQDATVEQCSPVPGEHGLSIMHFQSPIQRAAVHGGPSAAQPDDLHTAASAAQALGTSKGSFWKTIPTLPPHTHIRIAATAHFVDDWQGETCFLKVNNQVVWTDSHTSRNIKTTVNICGDPSFGEDRFTVPIDVVLPAVSTPLLLEFGSTLPQDAVGFFGISSLSLYVRSIEGS